MSEGADERQEQGPILLPSWCVQPRAMTNAMRERALLKPESVFRNPREVVDAPGWNHDERIEILTSWQNQLVELQRATEENMPKAGAPAETATRLSEVCDALLALGHESAGSTPTH